MVTGFSSEGKHRFFFVIGTLGQVPRIMGERTEQQSLLKGDIPWVAPPWFKLLLTVPAIPKYRCMCIWEWDEYQIANWLTRQACFTLPIMQASLWLSIYTSLFSTDKTNQFCSWVSQCSPFFSDKFSRQPGYGKDCGAFILCAVTYVRQSKYILKENNLQLIFTQETN